MRRHGLFTAEQLAESFSVSVSTIDDYARKGLIRSITLHNGVFYSGSDFIRLKLIAKGRSMGFTVDELKLIIESAKKSGQE